jgi:hypothetical protein
MNNTILIIAIFTIIVFFIFNNKNKQDIEFDEKMKLLDQMINETKKNIANKIEYKNSTLQHDLLHQQLPVAVHPVIPPPIDVISNRDRAVVMDQLYPPLGRVERPLFDQLAAHVSTGMVGYPTRGYPDTFRLIGYMVNEENKSDNWKLFGRQKYPGSSIGEYYAIPIDDRKSDMKITIKDDMMVKDKIRDIYALPNEVTINSPLFSKKPYKIVELDKADLTSPYL